MKRINNIYYSICNLDNIRYIYDNFIIKNTKNKVKIVKFDDFYMENIIGISNDLSNKKYNPGKYNIFLIREPKIRVVMSQNIYDKVINHLVSFYILKPVIEPCLIDQNIATRNNKGTDYGIKLIKKYINQIKLESDKFYILKFDISKYFYNIDHAVLKKLIQRKVKDKDALRIIYDIINSTNQEYINQTITKLVNNCIDKINDKKIIKELKRIPLYKKDKGLPIGNMTSQILAIFYLNDLDHYIKEKLKIKYYIRYMDDGILLHKSKAYLKKCLKDIEFLIKEHKLQLNSKTKIYSSNDKIEFLGFNYYLKKKKLIVKVKTATKKRYKKKAKVLFIRDKKKYNQVIKSYHGHLRYGTSKNLIYEVTKKL